MKLVISWKHNGVGNVRTVEGTRDECHRGLGKVMKEFSLVTSFTVREDMDSVEIHRMDDLASDHQAEAAEYAMRVRPMHRRCGGFDAHRDGLD